MHETMRKYEEEERVDTQHHAPFTSNVDGQHSGQHTSPAPSSTAPTQHTVPKHRTLGPAAPSINALPHSLPQEPLQTPMPDPAGHPQRSTAAHLRHAHPQQQQYHPYQPHAHTQNSHDPTYTLPASVFSNSNIHIATHPAQPSSTSPSCPLAVAISPLTRTELVHTPVPYSPASPLTHSALAAHNAQTSPQPRYRQAQREASVPLAITASTRCPTEAVVWATQGARAAAVKAVQRVDRGEVRGSQKKREEGVPVTNLSFVETITPRVPLPTAEEARWERRVERERRVQRERTREARLVDERVRFAGVDDDRDGIGLGGIANAKPNLREIYQTGPPGEGELLVGLLKKAFSTRPRRPEAELPAFRGDAIRPSVWKIPKEKVEENTDLGFKAVRYEDTEIGRLPKMVEKIPSPAVSSDSPTLPATTLPAQRIEGESAAGRRNRSIPFGLQTFHEKALEIYNAHQRDRKETQKARVSKTALLTTSPELLQPLLSPTESQGSSAMAATSAPAIQQPEIQSFRPARPAWPTTMDITFDFLPSPASFPSPKSSANLSESLDINNAHYPEVLVSKESPRPPPTATPQAPARPRRSPVDASRNASMKQRVEVRQFPQTLRPARVQELKQEQHPKSPPAFLTKWRQKVRSPLNPLVQSSEKIRVSEESKTQGQIQERDYHTTRNDNDIVRAILGQRNTKTKQSKLKATISPPAPLMTTNPNAVNLSSASGGVGGPHAALSLPFRTFRKTTRAAEKPLPTLPSRPKSSKKAKGKELRIEALQNVHMPKIVSAKYSRLSRGTTLSDLMHPLETGKSFFGRSPSKKPGRGRKSSDESFACQGIPEENEDEGMPSPTSIYLSGVPPSVHQNEQGPFDDDKWDLYEPPPPPKRGANLSSPSRGVSGRQGAADARAAAFFGNGKTRASSAQPSGVARTQAQQKLLYEFVDTDDEAEYVPRPLAVRKSANNESGKLPCVAETEADTAMGSAAGAKRPRPRDTGFYEPYHSLLEEYRR